MSGRILVVDDDEFGREVLTRALVQQGFDALASGSGADALKRLESEEIALLILDFVMPEMDGVAVCQAVRQHPEVRVARTPIIMLTGFSGDDQEIKCLRAGANDFVTKPVNAAVLRARIETHLRLREMREQLEIQNRKLEEWREELERDLEAARLTQQAILPQRHLSIPGWDFASVYQPVIQVGGDIYDWTMDGEGHLCFWIADATGHGAAAALLTALAKLLFRHAVEARSNPREVLRNVNEEFRTVFRGRFLLTAICARLDPATNELLVAGAGHPPAAVLRNRGAVELFNSDWPPLGLATFDQGGTQHTRLHPGDRFLLFTDGLYGMPRADGSRVDLKELLAVLERNDPHSSEKWLSAMLARLRKVWGEGEEPWPDDIAAITGLRVQ